MRGLHRHARIKRLRRMWEGQFEPPAVRALAKEINTGYLVHQHDIKCTWGQQTHGIPLVPTTQNARTMLVHGVRQFIDDKLPADLA